MYIAETEKCDSCGCSLDSEAYNSKNPKHQKICKKCSHIEFLSKYVTLSSRELERVVAEVLERETFFISRLKSGRNL